MFYFATFFRVASALAVGSWLTGCAGLRSDELPVSSFTARAAAAAEAARVVRVIDADTYIMLSGGSTYRLRLLGVDAPEPDQAFGPQAADSVAKLLPVGRVVLVAKVGHDLYGRTLGAVLLPTSTVAAAGWPVSLDSLLVVRGWAWAYDPDQRVAGRAAQQAQAAQWGRGLWKCGDSQAVSPKLWRSFDARNKRRYRGSCTW